MFYLIRLLFLYLSLLFFVVSMAAAQFSIDSSHPQCVSYQCGHIQIDYPFRRRSIETDSLYCGYPGFGINCQDTGERIFPSMILGHDSYYVYNISYETNTIVLVDYDVSTAVPLVDCPSVRHNISIENSTFLFAEKNVNLSFHFNCNGVPSFAREIPCLSHDYGKSSVNMLNDQPANFSWDEYSCDDAVVTTVSNNVSGSASRLGTEFIGALRGGFDLKYEPLKDCQTCEQSGDYCGYNKLELEFMCFCAGGTITNGDCKGSAWNRNRKLVLGVGSAVLSVVLMLIIYCSRKSSRNKFIAIFKHQTDVDRTVEAFVIQYGSLSTKRYTYADIKKMTKSFKVKLGEGGFGTVFKGKLPDGRLVAVKVLLNSSKANVQDFINEVASIGRTSHVNIVTLLGFCFENKKRALIYEFMPNGSLEKFIYGDIPLKTNKHIGVEKLFEVALGIARGLDYLHRGCNTRILHLDIKPHNILLDEDFCPKIADFGLAKLYSWKESMVSMIEARGTIGYGAPEVFNRINFGGVSHKSDVYSYGMLILEMVGRRKNLELGVGPGHTSEIHFPCWIYDRLKKDEFMLDGLTTEEDNDYARKMTIVGLWCIQYDPQQRPSIDEVIEMLEGSIEALEIPPKPVFSSAL